MADFFDDTNKEETDKIKLGDQEFSEDELQDLIGAGKKLKEIEEKQGQPVEDILTSWGRRGETIGELKKKAEEAEKLKEEIEALKNPPSKEEVDQEAVKKQVYEEMKALGYAPKDELLKEFNELYNRNRDGERLLSQVKKVAREAKSDGKPEIEPEKLLEFMADPANPKDPQKAYNVMFEKELDDWKTERINKAKGSSIPTETKSNAGGKEFTPKKPASREELRSSLTDSLYGGSGQ